MISILMPVKNAERFLKQTLDSILAQSYENWELIAINDHSMDGSLEILKEYADQDERISVYKNAGHGIIDALTMAQLKSKGKWITRMDADDLMHRDKLKLFRAELKKHPKSIITSYVKYFSESELGDGYKRYEKWLNSLIDNDSHYQEVYKECVLPSPNWAMSRKTLEKIGGFSDLNYPEDYDLAFMAYRKKIPVKGIKKKLHYWRDYPERTSRNDEHYRDNAFLKLKVHHFIDIDYDKDKQLNLWSAGKKGKEIAKQLSKLNVDFQWVTENKKKINKEIYGVRLKDTSLLKNKPNYQLIIAIAGPDDQKDIQKQLEDYKKIAVYWFC